MTLTVWTHGLAAAAYLLLGVVAIVRGLPRTGSIFFSVAALATGVWAALASTSAMGMPFTYWPRIAEIVRSWTWIVVVIMLAWPLATGSKTIWKAFAAIAAILGAVGILALLLSGGERSAGIERLCAIGLAVVGLVVVENLFRNLSESEVWALKYLLIALSTLFFLDIIVHSIIYLFGDSGVSVAAARAIVITALIPLLLVTAVRDASIAINLYASRRIVFYSATLIAAGFYLIVTALIGAYARMFGGAAGTTLAAVLIVLAILGLALALLSGTVRSAIKLFISQNFFSYKYDYRVEWNRLIATISTDNDLLGFHARSIKAIADIVDSHSGLLWMREDGRPELTPVAGWSIPAPSQLLPGSDPVVQHLEDRNGILDLGNRRSLPVDWDERWGATALGAYADAWLIVPLTHRDRMAGLILLMAPRVSRTLDDEDYGLLRLIGQQIASYLVEEMSYRALLDSRQLEDFNKRFAFVAHDLKNLVGQLSLMVRNAEKFGDDPEFQKDLLATLRNSVDKMRALLEQLSQGRAAVERERKAGHAVVTTDLARLVHEVAGRWLAGGRRILVEEKEKSVEVVLPDIDKLTNVLEHLLQNAVEATPGDGIVTARVGIRDGRGMVELIDKGGGMDPEFVRTELFRPFRTTKGSGFGIGAYQSRETVRDLGGDLEVDSARGQGTTMRILLPLSGPTKRGDASLRQFQS